ncbi:MAG: hypothetical protein ACKN89_14980 [Cyanobium sp.]
MVAQAHKGAAFAEDMKHFPGSPDARKWYRIAQKAWFRYTYQDAFNKRQDSHFGSDISGLSPSLQAKREDDPQLAEALRLLAQD